MAYRAKNREKYREIGDVIDQNFEALYKAAEDMLLVTKGQGIRVETPFGNWNFDPKCHHTFSWSYADNTENKGAGTATSRMKK